MDNDLPVLTEQTVHTVNLEDAGHGHLTGGIGVIIRTADVCVLIRS